MKDHNHENEFPSHIKIYEALSRDLTMGNYTPGEKLPISKLAKLYGFGLMPVREAVQRLAAEEAITVVANRMAHVPQLDEVQILDLTCLLELYDSLALKALIKSLKRNDDRAQSILDIAIEMNRKLSDPVKEEYLLMLSEYWENIYEVANANQMKGLRRCLLLRAGSLIALPFQVDDIARNYYLKQHTLLLIEIANGLMARNSDHVLSHLNKLYKLILSCVYQHYELAPTGRTIESRETITKSV